MKKWILLFTMVFVIFMMLGHRIYALEETKTKYFGIGATVEEVEQATFTVKTEGVKPGEGFVYTPEKVHPEEKVIFQVALQGEGTVYMKVVETDANGKFITEISSPMILLSDDWKEYKLATKTNKNTDQMDVFVITDGKQQIDFQFRDANLVSEKRR